MPGQFAIRGVIIDIYSFGNEHPYRIELFDTEVESIRLFDPESQLSLKQLLQVKIVPNVEHDFDEEDRMNLLEYLPKNTIVWVEDVAFMAERLTAQKKKYNEMQSSENFELLLKPNNIVAIEPFLQLLNERVLIDFGTNTASMVLPSLPHQTIECHTKPQPAFNRNFDLLIDHLNDKTAEMYNLFVCAENTKQTARLQSIFEDLEQNIIFTALPISLSGGFIDDDLKIVF